MGISVLKFWKKTSWYHLAFFFQILNAKTNQGHVFEWKVMIYLITGLNLVLNTITQFPKISQNRYCFIYTFTR